MKILEKIHSSRYYILLVQTGNPEGVSAKVHIFRKQGGTVIPEGELPPDGLNEVLSQLPKFAALIVVFSGEQVLTRFSSEGEVDLFDEIDASEFYFQMVQSKQNLVVHSACRKTIVDAVLDRLRIEKVFVLSMCLGAGCILAMEDIIQEGAVSSGHLSFEFSGGIIHRIREMIPANIQEDSGQEIAVAGTMMNSSTLSGLAALMRYFKDSDKEESFFKEQNKQYKFFQRCKKSSIAVLGILFVLLLTNFFVFSGLRKNLDHLKNSGEFHMAKVQQIERLNAQIEEYKHLSHVRNRDPQHTYAYYLEEIAANRPAGIWFNSLELHPPIKKPEKNKAYEVDRSLLLLEGEAKNPVSLSEFITELKTLMWIKDVELLHYENSFEKSYDDFVIRINKEK